MRVSLKGDKNIKLLKKIIFKVIFAFGIIFVLSGIVMVFNRILFLNNAITVQGEVISLQKEITKDNDNHTSIIYKPEVKFQTKSGEVITFVSKVGSNPPSFSVGRIIEVVYNPEYPNNAELNSFLSLWFVQMVFIALGVIFIVISIVASKKICRGEPMGKSYNVKFSGAEMIYLLFRKKICPVCGEKMKKEKKVKNLGIGYSRWGGVDGVSYMYGNRYKVKYYFNCEKCSKANSIKELAERK